MKMRNVKRWLASLLCVAMLFSTLSVFGAVPKAHAAGMSIEQLREKYPHNKYWNHYGMSGNNADGYTDHECTGHNYCNSFIHNGTKWSSQCMGFAQQLAYLYSGSDPIDGDGWRLVKYRDNHDAYFEAIDNAKTGDVITYYEPTSTAQAKTHTVFVTEVSGDTLYLAECNYGGPCVIHWGRTMTKAKLKSRVNYYTTIRVSPSTNPNPCTCSTAYAGWYQETGSGGANVNSRHSKNWGDKVGVIAKGEYVYVSKATGNGSGNLGHIMYNGVERYIAMGLFKRMSGSPIGSVDSYGADAGSVWVNGWAFDWDNCESQLTIEVCLDDNVILRGTANTERSDVNNKYSSVVGSYHGFSLRADTSLTGLHKMDIYAVNVGSGENKCIGSVVVNIPVGDKDGPVISDVKVTNVTNKGYDVSCTVTDPSGVERVMFPTWTTANGQDDLLSDWNTNPKARGTQNGDTWTFHVDIADHNNEGGEYGTDIHAYDKYGNANSLGAPRVSIDTEAPVISDVKVSNITTEGYDVSCTVTDNVGVNRVVFPTWTVLNDQDDMIKDWGSDPKTRGTQSGDTWTFHVNVADHNNEHGAYLTHIYAFDDAGNHSAVGSEIGQIIVPEPYPAITFDACGGRAEFTEKQLERNADGMHYGALPEAWMDGYVFDGWYTDAVDGTRVSRTTAYTAEGNTTLYAHWTPVAADAEQGWSLQDGTLVITAQGAMQDHDSAAQTPWFKDRAEIRKIVVQQGVTTIGDYAFYGCENVTSVTLPDTVTQIGKLAFYGCKNLRTLTVPDSVLVVEDYAFAKAGLQSIVFRGSAPVLGAGIFAGLNAEVRYPTAAAGWTEEVRQSYTGSVNWLGVGTAALAAEESELQLDDPVLAALLADSCV